MGQRRWQEEGKRDGGAARNPGNGLNLMHLWSCLVYRMATDYSDNGEGASRMLPLRMRNRHWAARLAGTAMAATFLTLVTVPATGQTPSPSEFVPVTDAILQNPADGDWLTWRRTLDSWGSVNLEKSGGSRS